MQLRVLPKSNTNELGQYLRWENVSIFLLSILTLVFNEI